MMKKRKKLSKTPRAYFLKEWHLLNKSLRQVLQEVLPKKALVSQEMTAPCCYYPEDLPVGRVVEVEDSDIDDPEPG